MTPRKGFFWDGHFYPESLSGASAKIETSAYGSPRSKLPGGKNDYALEQYGVGFTHAEIIGGSTVDTRSLGEAMRLKGSRLFWTLDALLLGGALLFSAYKVVNRVQPLTPDEQWRYPRKVDPQAQILEYYRQYPERYLRISMESWQYLEEKRTALHSFTLRNTATVAYTEIEIRFSYETSNGKNLKVEVVKIPGTLAALKAMDLKDLKIKNVPAASEKVTTSVVKAVIAR